MEKIYEHLSKVSTEVKVIEKTSSEADFYQFWLDFGVPRPAQKHKKMIKNAGPKNSKKM